MIDAEELRNDLKNNSLEMVLNKYDITLGEAFKVLHANAPKKPRPKQKPTGEKYISDYFGKFVIRKTINGKLKYFGSYATLEDAILVRDYLAENGWYYQRINSIRKRLGV